MFSPLALAQTFTIEGRVIDEENRGVAYANVILLSTDDESIISGTTTDDEGAYTIESVSLGTYIIRVSFIGYKEVEQQIELTQNRVLTPVILVEAAETLSEVEITVKKPTLTRKPDRLVFNVQSTALSEGNVMEVINRTPGVLVLGNNITVKNSNPEFYINDRKVNLNSSDIIQLLEGTSASTIQSVEVITNPSARYDADSGTIINIVMLKNLITGYQGSVFGRFIQGVFPKYSMGTSQFLKNETLSFFLNYSYNDQKIDRVNREEVFYPDNTWRSLIDRNTWSDTHTVNFNFDADLGEHDRLSISSNMLFLPYFKYLTRNNTQIDPALPDSFASFNANNLSRDLKHNMGFNVDYEHRFKKNNSRLIVNGHATLYDYRRNQSVESEYFLEDGSNLERNAFRTRADQNTAIY
ncbi:MAG: glucosamine-6-phosphate deaminase, partial [Flavobacteriaceae bacterium]|nr:glucosamine-6-phosphate deaminase [Flavobacteriaceae bacterium]